MQVEETAIRPVAGRGEENEQEGGAVDAGSVEDVGEGDEGDDEEGRGVSWDEEEGKPAVCIISILICHAYRGIGE